MKKLVLRIVAGLTLWGCSDNRPPYLTDRCVEGYTKTEMVMQPVVGYNGQTTMKLRPVSKYVCTKHKKFCVKAEENYSGPKTCESLLEK